MRKIINDGVEALTRKPKARYQIICLILGKLRFFSFGSLVILDVACCYLWLFSLYINIKIG